MESYKLLNLSELNFSGQGLATVIGLVSPELAGELLKRNMKTNRSLSTGTINGYVRKINAGEWTIGETLKFNTKGELIDGQHRLNAVVKTGYPQPFVIISNYPDEAAEVIDQGKKRNSLDVVRMRGVDGANVHSISIIRMIYMVANSFGSSHHVTPLSVPAVATAYEIYKERLSFCLGFYGKQNSRVFAPVLSVVFAAYPYENHERLSEFLQCWHSGIVVKGACDNAAIALRNYYLETQATKGRNGSEYRYEMFKKGSLLLRRFWLIKALSLFAQPKSLCGS